MSKVIFFGKQVFYSIKISLHIANNYAKWNIIPTILLTFTKHIVKWEGTCPSSNLKKGVFLKMFLAHILGPLVPWAH